MDGDLLAVKPADFGSSTQPVKKPDNSPQSKILMQAQYMVINRTVRDGPNKGSVNIEGLARDVRATAGKPDHEARKAAVMGLLSPENRSKLEAALKMPGQPLPNMHVEALRTAGDALVGGAKNFIPDTANGLATFGENLTFQKPGSFGRVDQWHTYRNGVARENAYVSQSIIGTGLAVAGLQVRMPSASALLRNARQAAFGETGAGGMRVKGPSVASGLGNSAPATIVRTIQQGEKIADIVNEAKALTFQTGNEHAVVTLANGQRALVSGGPGGIRFEAGAITRIFGHTHPTGAPASAADFEATAQLGQSKQYVFHGGEVTIVRPPR